ncbi:MAG: panthothenate synthetase [Verrucomicrobia bacterium]|nr:MAG: panthothenate synthetase [Verrucomicrobiota bacterium]
MRMLLNVKIPHEPFNTAVKDGTAGAKLKKILDAIKPEAAYFTEQDGQRGGVLVVDLPDPSKIPSLVEPWLLTFQADIELRVVMTPADLEKAALDSLGKQWG